MKFPDFIIVGVMKGGTTVLWHNLNKHPDIFMGKNPEDPKIASTEIRFWNNGAPYRVYSKGIDWYKKLFNGKIAGEKCANYIESKAVMKKIKKYIPHCKIIVCLRNPVHRAYSEAQMQRTKINSGHIARGMYASLLRNNVLSIFSREQVYIIIQERMKKETNVEINRFYDFLGVTPLLMEVKQVDWKAATSRTLDLEEDKRQRYYKCWHSEYGPIPKQIVEELSAIYEQANLALFNLIGEEILEWK